MSQVTYRSALCIEDNIMYKHVNCLRFRLYTKNNGCVNNYKDIGSCSQITYVLSRPVREFLPLTDDFEDFS